jgi:endonuclease-3
MRAFIELDMRIGVDPNSLVRASEEAIIDSIRVAGLYKNKARAIKELSRMMIERYDGDLMKILEMPLDRAREELLSMPNVGEKTADIILLFIARRPVFPVDTHIFRVSIRLGLADRRDYSKVSGMWRSLLEPCDYMEAHHLLIGLGREICKPKKPECYRCPINDLCDYYSNLYKSKQYFSSQ